MNETKDRFVYLRNSSDWAEYKASCIKGWNDDWVETEPDTYPCFANAYAGYDGQDYLDFIFLYDDEIDAMRNTKNEH